MSPVSATAMRCTTCSIRGFAAESWVVRIDFACREKGICRYDPGVGIKRKYRRTVQRRCRRSQSCATLIGFTLKRVRISVQTRQRKPVSSPRTVLTMVHHDPLAGALPGSGFVTIPRPHEPLLKTPYKFIFSGTLTFWPHDLPAAEPRCD